VLSEGQLVVLESTTYRKVVGDAALVLDFRGITRGIEASNLVPL
jgi:hypothetical protein